MLVSIFKLTTWEMCVVLYMFELCVLLSLIDPGCLPSSLGAEGMSVANVVTLCVPSLCGIYWYISYCIRVKCVLHDFV